MFKHLPENLMTAINQGLVPWKEIVREDYHVTVFRYNDDMIFAARYPTERVLGDCLTDAITTGRLMVLGGECSQFTVSYESGDGSLCWPHIKLMVQK